MQEMTITSVHALGPRYAVILKEKDADRYLPILVGASDANAIAIKLHNPQVSLNLTHDLLCTVIDALGGSVRQVLINRDCPDQKERCCLRSSTIGGRGPFCPPGYVRRSEDRLSEPQYHRLDHRRNHLVRGPGRAGLQDSRPGWKRVGPVNVRGLNSHPGRTDFPEFLSIGAPFPPVATLLTVTSCAGRDCKVIQAR